MPIKFIISMDAVCCARLFPHIAGIKLLVLLVALRVVPVPDVLSCINSCRDEGLRHAIFPRAFFRAIAYIVLFSITHTNSNS